MLDSVYNNRIVKVLLVVCLLLSDNCFCYEIPEPLVEAFSPRGFRISIPDEPGVQFVAIQANLNEPVSPLTQGEFSGEVPIARNGRWTFESKNAQLQPGDILYYWMFVQHERLGYRKDDGRVIIADLSSRSDSFTNNNNLNKQPNTDNCIQSLTTINENKNVCKGQLIFEENFNSKKLDNTKWRQDCHIPSDEEDNEYVSYQARPENLILSNSRLTIRPAILKDQEFVQAGELNLTNICGCQEEKYGYCNRAAMSYNILQPVVSASIRSKFSFKYGKIQIRAKLPKGNWLYPLLNLEPLNFEYGSGYKSGKIRIAFARGNKKLLDSDTRYDYGANEMNAGLLLGQFKPRRDQYTRLQQAPNDEYWYDDFHTYEVVWTPNNIQLSVDGINYAVISPPPGGFKIEQDPNQNYLKNWDEDKMAPFNKNMVIRIALACGGVTDFPDDTMTSSSSGPLKTKPWKNLDPKAMLRFWEDKSSWESTWLPDASLQVEYVKVWSI